MVIAILTSVISDYWRVRRSIVFVWRWKWSSLSSSTQTNIFFLNWTHLFFDEIPESHFYFDLENTLERAAIWRNIPINQYPQESRVGKCLNLRSHLLEGNGQTDRQADRKADEQCGSRQARIGQKKSWTSSLHVFSLFLSHTFDIATDNGKLRPAIAATSILDLYS